jgi:enolase
MSAIVDVVAREILDSRGNPTVEADVLLESGVMGRAAVPSGASTGSREAIELRDGDPARYLGKGVVQAVENVNTEISEAIIGLDAEEQAFVDKAMNELDGTENKSRLGANAILAVSMAVAKAAAEEAGLPLYRYFGGSGPMSMPVPMMNVINGGAHANNNLDIQEFMILPVGAASFREALRCGAEVFHNLKKLVDKKGYPTTVGDEGGFAPQCVGQRRSHRTDPQGHRNRRLHAGPGRGAGPRLRKFRVLQGRQVHPGFGKAGADLRSLCRLPGDAGRPLPDHQHRGRHGRRRLGGWKTLTDKLGKRVQIVGDDLFVTNPKILREGIQKGIANSILIKINQIGTLTETFAAVEMAKRAGYTNVISHRSGETEDSTIADIAVGLNAGQIKTGSLSRSDRIAKYNQLLRIEEDLGDTVTYPGLDAFYNLRK